METGILGAMPACPPALYGRQRALAHQPRRQLTCREQLHCNCLRTSEQQHADVLPPEAAGGSLRSLLRPESRLVQCHATTHQKHQQRQAPVSWPLDLEPREVESLREAAEQPINVPILSGAGGGLFFWWELGVVKYLQQRYDLTTWQMRGASAGALVATLAACNVGTENALTVAHRLAVDNGIFERRLGLAGVWGGLVREWLDEVLPADAAELCRGRLKLVVTSLRSLQLTYIDDWDSKAELIEANMASAHIPFFLDWKPFAMYRGQPYLDGSVTDFVYYDNSHLLKCNGDAFILDYSQDQQLHASRIDFIRLRDEEGIRELIDAGYAYAQRTEAAGGFDRFFGGRAGALHAPNAAVFT